MRLIPKFMREAVKRFLVLDVEPGVEPEGFTADRNFNAVSNILRDRGVPQRPELIKLALDGLRKQKKLNEMSPNALVEAVLDWINTRPDEPKPEDNS